MVRNVAVASGQQVSSAPRGWRGREEPLSETKRDYRVSPAKPPVHSRFKKDQSGNRRGPRPKSRPALLVDALKKKVVATIDGERREITPPRGKEGGSKPLAGRR
jgi:hypothetical protein